MALAALLALHGAVLIAADEAAEEEGFVVRSEQFRVKMRHLRRLAEFLQAAVARNRTAVLGLVPQIRRWESKARSMEVRPRALRGDPPHHLSAVTMKNHALFFF